MQRILVLIAIAGMTTACNQSGSRPGTESSAQEQEEIVSATIEQLLAEPEAYAGKEVAVSGMVTHVCRHGGQKCFVLADDGETQIRIVPGGKIDEFKIDLEGSTVAFRGEFIVMNPEQTRTLVEDHESQAHHAQEMAHTEAEKAEYYIEASDFREITR